MEDTRYLKTKSIAKVHSFTCNFNFATVVVASMNRVANALGDKNQQKYVKLVMFITRQVYNGPQTSNLSQQQQKNFGQK